MDLMDLTQWNASRANVDASGFGTDIRCRTALGFLGEKPPVHIKIAIGVNARV